MRKIKIIFIINNLGQGGAEKQLISLIKGLDKSLFEITVYLYACQIEPFYKDFEHNADIIYIKNTLCNKILLLKIIEAFRNIRVLLNKNKYDIVFSTLFMNNFLVRLAAQKEYNNKVIANVRTSVKLYSKMRLLAEKCQIQNSYMVLNSNSSYNEIIKHLPPKHYSKVSVIYNGFAIPEKEIPNGSEFTFGSLGRYSPEKNILQTVRVFQEYEKYKKDAKLIIQGHYGSQYDQIVKTVISKNIEIRAKDPNIEKFYSSINILILPSLFEGCPNVLFEALLRKKLCIISQAANSDNFIQDGMNGFVYDGTDQDLLNTLIKVTDIMGTEEIQRIKINGYQYASDKFNMSKMIYSYEQLILNIYGTI